MLPSTTLPRGPGGTRAASLVSSIVMGISVLSSSPLLATFPQSRPYHCVVGCYRTLRRSRLQSERYGKRYERKVSKESRVAFPVGSLRDPPGRGVGRFWLAHAPGVCLATRRDCSSSRYPCGSTRIHKSGGSPPAAAAR